MILRYDVNKWRFNVYIDVFRYVYNVEIVRKIVTRFLQN